MARGVEKGMKTENTDFLKLLVTHVLSYSYLEESVLHR